MAESDASKQFRPNHYGAHRVLEPPGALPQAAHRLDAQTAHIDADELGLDGELPNIDSASFRQIEQSAGGQPNAIAARVRDIVAERGKLHNPVTGSGGMLLGRVSPKSGAAARARFAVAVGDRVATLVSLTLTPLSVSQWGRVRPAAHQIEARGEAIVFASGMIARMPPDFSEPVALAALDVAGAAPQVARLAAGLPRPARALVLGCGGKSGLLASA